MHIPDGFLDTKTIVATSALSVAGIGAAWQQTKGRMPASRTPLLGVTAAFVFAAQMLNFPIVGGTSGHLMGAVLASVLVGPGASVIVMTAVLVVQCFLFADGGLLALGANIFNMAFVGSVGGYAVYRLCHSLMRGEKGRMMAAAFAAWCSVVLASLCCAGELAWSGTVAAGAAFPAMAGVHAIIGVGEGFVTFLVIAALQKVRPDLLKPESGKPAVGRNALVAYGLLLSLGLIIFVTPVASKWPDGLGHVAASLGFDWRAFHGQPVSSPFQGYRFPGISSDTAAMVLAGIVGVILVFAFSFLLSRGLLTRMRVRENKGRSASS